MTMRVGENVRVRSDVPLCGGRIGTIVSLDDTKIKVRFAGNLSYESIWADFEPIVGYLDTPPGTVCVRLRKRP
jgi:hypothetical protein